MHATKLKGCWVAEGWERCIFAKDEESKAPVVIKVLQPSIGASDYILYDILSRYPHPSFACILNTGQLSDGRSYAVMESVSGVNLRTRIGPRAMGFVASVNVFSQLTDALSELHAHSIIHRDIKPENIMVQDPDRDLRVKLIDFGVVKGLASVIRSDTQRRNC